VSAGEEAADLEGAPGVGRGRGPPLRDAVDDAIADRDPQASPAVAVELGEPLVRPRRQVADLERAAGIDALARGQGARADLQLRLEGARAGLGVGTPGEPDGSGCGTASGAT